jgi:tRNA A-37 threonylcarbamoyl transferase component Bud32
MSEPVPDPLPDTQAGAPPPGEALPPTVDEPRAPSSTAPSRPAVTGYEILEELGRGGMGVVYKARQKSLNRLVALKMVLAGEHAAPEAVARFKAEAEAVARLHHPHVVHVYEIGEQEGRPFLVLEYVGGGSLAGRVRGRPQPARESAALTETLARAIHAAHGQHVVHRDLKPGNVLLTEDGQPRIVDFGLAKLLDGATVRTQTGAIVGTPGYMAPEQASPRKQPVGPAADVYALGAILYELLTGRAPFQGETPLETVYEVLHADPVPPSRRHPGVPADLETICLKCLRKAPGDRYASALELAEDCAAFLRGEPIRARPPGRWERGRRWARRQRGAALVLAGAAAALALVLLLAHWGLLPGRPGVPPPEGGGVGDQPGTQPEAVALLRQDLDLVPPNAVGFYSLRPAALWQVLPLDRLGPALRPMLGPETQAALTEESQRLGLSLPDFDRLTSVIIKERPLKTREDLEKLITGGQSEVTIYRTLRPYDRQRILDSLGPQWRERQAGGKVFQLGGGVHPRAVCCLGEHVFLQGHPSAVEFLLERTPDPNAPGPLRDALELAAGGHHLVVGFNPGPRVVQDWSKQLSEDLPAFRAHADALAEVNSAALTLDFVVPDAPADPLNLRGHLHLYFADESDAARGRQAADAALALVRKETREVFEAVKESPRLFETLMVVYTGGDHDVSRAFVKVLVPLDASLQQAVVGQKGRAVRAETLLTGAADVVGGFALTLRWVMHDETKKHLRKIGKAMHAYHKEHGHLPPPALRAADGRPLLSWRVLLLPHLDAADLYKQFHLDEPWDSAHNRTLLEKIPPVYAAEAFNTRVPHGTLYQLATGPGTLFEGRQGPPLDAIKDGPEQTILLVEAGESVEWTKPLDVAVTAGKPLPSLGGTFWEGFYALFADGKERFLRRPVEERTLRALLTPAGGEKVDLKKQP